MHKDVQQGQFDFLVDKALSSGAVDAKVVPAGKVFVEDRVRLKCRVGCVGYGKKLTCSRHCATGGECRKMLSECGCVLLVKFRSPAEADEATRLSTYRNWLDPAAPQDARENAAKFWTDYFGDSKRILLTMLELEKSAFNAGYTLAVAFTSGSCRLCEKCNLENGICLHPNMARIPEHAVGINMKKTAAEAGMPLSFPIGRTPEPMAILLID